MNPGKLRHRVVVEQPARIKDSYGEESIESDTWSTFATAWASIEPLSGKELWNAQQVIPLLTHRVVMRYLVGVTSEMRVNYKGRYLQILSWQHIEERTIETHLMCMEKAA